MRTEYRTVDNEDRGGARVMPIRKRLDSTVPVNFSTVNRAPKLDDHWVRLHWIVVHLTALFLDETSNILPALTSIHALSLIRCSYLLSTYFIRRTKTAEKSQCHWLLKRPSAVHLAGDRVIDDRANAPSIEENPSMAVMA